MTSEFSTSGTVEIPGIEFSKDFTVEPDSVTRIQLPDPTFGTGETSVLTDGQAVEKGVHVTSEDPIAVYGIDQIQFTTDGYLGLPRSILSTTYIVPSYTSLGSGDRIKSQVAVVSPRDGNTVSITPSASTVSGRNAGETFDVTLDKGEAYQIRASSSSGDLTGTVIQSSLPVSTFGGHACANVPRDVSFCDHLIEQIPPTETWGERFVTTPLQSRDAGDTFRILAGQNDTDVTINGETVATLDFGDYYETILDSSSVIQTSNPALVMQYMNGSQFDQGSNGDPFMMMVPPSDQFGTQYAFSTPSAGFIENFVSMTSPADAIGSLTFGSNVLPPWRAQGSGTSEGFFDVAFADASTGWAVGFNGEIVHTEDGGETWNAQTSGTSEFLTTVAFADASTGWAVGENGEVLHTEDGGETWSAQTSGTSETLYDMAFTDASTGWAVGDNGEVLHTEDGGETWSAQTSGTSEQFNGVAFTDASTGWAVGDNGEVLHTEDGGETWSTQASGTSEDLFDVAFADASTGWAVGRNGEIVHTEDGGETWNAQISGTSELFTAVAFTDASTGWAVGHFGEIVHTEDGGETWSAQTSGTSEDLFAVAFTDASTGWAVGDNGEILRFQPDRSIAEIFTPIEGSEFAAGGLELDLGSYIVQSTTDDQFGLYAYGQNDDDSYGLTGGLLLEFIEEQSGPEIARTDGTINLGDEAQLDRESLTIAATITKEEDPAVQSASLFYRTEGDSSDYSVVEMANPQGDRWEADIPADSVKEPGVEYYIAASDGQFRTTSPSVDPQGKPYSIAVLPNEPPEIDPPSEDESLPTIAFPGGDFTIEVTASDSTLAEVVIRYRIAGGNPAYNEIVMSNVEGDLFEATIPEDAITAEGLEYYIAAIDGFGVESTIGSVDDPIFVSTTGPSDITLSGTNATAEIEWTAVDGAVKYYVYRDREEITGNPANRTPIDSVDGSTLSYTDVVTLGGGYYYALVAAGENGSTTDFSSVESVFLYPEQVNASVERTFGEAATSSDYRLVALPGQVDQPLSETVRGEAGTEWQAYFDDGSEEDFLVEFDGSDTFRFQKGNGFWLTSTQSWVDSSEVTAVGLKGDSSAVIEVQEGWNIISNPTDRDIPWSRVQAQTPDTLQAIWSFDGSFAESDTFRSARTGRAYYFFNDNGKDSLSIPYPGASVSKGVPKSVKEAPMLSLTATPAKAKDASASTVRLGLSDDAERGIGSEDLIAPPGRFAETSLRIEAPDSEPSERTGLLMAEKRPPAEKAGGHTFPLRLETQAEGPIQLSAENLDAVEGQSVALLHPGAGTTYDLRETSMVTIEPDGETAELKVAIGTKDYVEGETSDVVPEEVRLTSYPNPVRQQGTVEYALPEEQKVTLRVYDVLGREVATLENGRKEPGRHRVQLETDQLASGVYFGRLQAGEQTRTLKITVVR